jgi:hypothetical protein
MSILYLKPEKMKTQYSTVAQHASEVIQIPVPMLKVWFIKLDFKH